MQISNTLSCLQMYCLSAASACTQRTAHAGLDFRQLQSVEEARSAALEALKSHAGVPDDHVSLQEIPKSPTVSSCRPGVSHGRL